MQRIAITSPDAVVAVLPYLVGYRPDDSLVIAWTCADRIVVVQRLDPPDAPVDRAAFMAEVVEPALRSHPDAATIVVTGPVTAHDAGLDPEHAAAGDASRSLGGVVRHADDRSGLDDIDCDTDVDVDATGRVVLPFASAVDDLRAAIVAAGIDVLDAIYTRDGRWWSYVCAEQCCPPHGRVVDPQADLVLRARFALDGIAPLTSRLDVVAQYDPDPRAQARLTPRLDAAVAERTAVMRRAAKKRAAWRAAALAGPCADILRPSSTDIDDDVLAELVCALGDRKVRDAFVLMLARQRSLAGIVGALASAVRAAPGGHLAPVATCAGIAAWLHGDGIRATIALERALDDDPACALAALIHTAIDVGVPPWEWRNSLIADLAA